MKSFTYVSATDVATALEAITQQFNAKFLGGGTNLVDLMRVGIEAPDTVVDITGLRLTDVIRSVDELRPNADINYLLIRRETPPNREITVTSADLIRRTRRRKRQ